MRIAITGGSGFVGRALTRQLQKQQHSVVWLSSVAPTVSDEFKDITVKTVNYQSVDSLYKAINGCEAIIHLVGILHQTKKASFDEVHHQLPQRVIEAAAKADITRYLHMSALGITEYAASQYLQSKYAGEKAAFALAKQRGVKMLSFRPSIIFGKEDSFFNQFAKLLRFSPVFPIVCPHAQFQPVSVNDVAKAFIWGLGYIDDRKNTEENTTFELVGKEIVTMQQCVERVCEFHGWKRLLIPLPDFISRWQGKLFSSVPNAPFTYDNYLSMQTPNISKRWDWNKMNIVPEPLTVID